MRRRRLFITLTLTLGLTAVVAPAAAQAGAVTGTLTRGTGDQLTYQLSDSAEPLNRFQLTFTDTLQFSTSLSDATCPAGWTLTTAFNSNSFTCDGGNTHLTSGASVTGTVTTTTCVPEGFVVNGMATDTQSSGVPPQEQFTLTAAGNCPGDTGQISGALTDPNGHVLPGVQVNVAGTDAQGNQVDQKAFTDIDGNYQATLSPGTYTVSPLAPGDPAGGRFVPSTCSGTVSSPACKVALNAGDHATASFKLVKLAVNSTADSEDPTQAALGVCDVTPSQPAQTCTLRQALDVANSLGGATITFNIPGSGTPLIQDSAELLPITAPMTIDGTSQPGSKEVAVTGVGAAIGFTVGSPGVTIRGMTIYGFRDHDVSLANGDTLEQNRLGTITSPQSPVSGVVFDTGAGHNVVQGNTIGSTAASPGTAGTTTKLLNLSGQADTIGGSLPGQGNVLTDGVTSIAGAGDVVQGNALVNASLLLGNQATLGGPTPVPGTGPGNDISGALHGVTLGSQDVVQGNHLHGNEQTGILVQMGDRDTIGGASPQMGNLVDHNGAAVPSQIALGGIAIGQPRGAVAGGSDNVIENNRIVDNRGDGGVVVYDGVGNQIIDNEMTANTLGINLGGGPFLYDSNISHAGPNQFQPYPQLYRVKRHDGLQVTGRLNASAGQRYMIELYSQPSCARDSITPGQGLHYLASRVLPEGIQFALDFPSAPAGQNAVTATATDGANNTSEFSPCLTLGHQAAAFVKSGVSPTTKTVAVTTAPAARGATRGVRRGVRRGGTRGVTAAVNGKPKPRTGRAHAVLSLFCPPITTRFCAGRFVLHTPGRHARMIVAKSFKLAPGQVATLNPTIPRNLFTKLKRARRLRAVLTVSAHDGAKRRHRKSTARRVTLVAKPA